MTRRFFFCRQSTRGWRTNSSGEVEWFETRRDTAEPPGQQGWQGDRKRIIASIFSRALGQLAVGAALGVALAAVIEKGSGNTLMRGNAPVVLPIVALFMMVVGFIAALGPARRGLRIEPTEALREQ